MELWIWLIALGIALLILVISVVVVGLRTISLGKKLKPFIDRMARFQKDAEQYPRALKFISGGTQPKMPPSDGDRKHQG